MDPDYFQVFAEMTRRFPNLYGDTSAFNSRFAAGTFRSVCASRWLERMVHGSDFPVPVHGHWAWLRGSWIGRASAAGSASPTFWSAIIN